MSEYESFNHQKYRLHYHLIFSTKYRQKCLVGLEDVLIDIIKQISRGSKFKVIVAGVDKDHIHLVIGSSPAVSIDKIVRKIKQESTWQLWKVEESHLKKFYYGEKRRLWTRGYFVSTLGSVSEDKVLEYVKNQGR